jgi:hypothetical protein
MSPANAEIVIIKAIAKHGYGLIFATRRLSNASTNTERDPHISLWTPCPH